MNNIKKSNKKMFISKIKQYEKNYNLLIKI